MRTPADIAAELEEYARGRVADGHLWRELIPEAVRALREAAEIEATARPFPVVLTAVLRRDQYGAWVRCEPVDHAPDVPTAAPRDPARELTWTRELACIVIEELREPQPWAVDIIDAANPRTVAELAAVVRQACGDDAHLAELSAGVRRNLGIVLPGDEP